MQLSRGRGGEPTRHDRSRAEPSEGTGRRVGPGAMGRAFVFVSTYYPSGTYRPTRNQLPILVGILAILIGIVGALILIVGLLVLLAGLGIAFMAHAPALLTGVAGDAVLIGGFYFIFGMVLLATARGLWDLESWALWLTAIVVFLLMLSSLLVASWVLFFVLLILFIYLLGVRRHFV